MKRIIFLITILSIVCLSGQVIFAGETVIFDTVGFINNSSIEYTTVYLDPTPNQYATLTMTGGQIGNLETWMTSTANISDGSITGVLDSWENSTVNLSGGTVASFNAFESSTANISGGTTEYLATFNDSIVNISDNAMIGDIETYNTSTVNISGDSIVNLTTHGSSFVDISGSASVGTLRTYSDSASVFSSVNISGGTVGEIDSYDDSEIHIYASEFKLVFDGDTTEDLTSLIDESIRLEDLEELYLLGGGTPSDLMGIAGLWSNGITFGIDLFAGREIVTKDNITLHTAPLAVPVPGAVMLAGVGLFSTGVFRRFRRI